jgi:uncharacterized damage-inducible protein DinB
MLGKPNADDAPAYAQKYFDLCTDKDLFLALHSSFELTLSIFSRFKREKEDHKYFAGKWSVKEVLSHIIDTERILAYRALCISRKDEAVFPSFNENLYVAEGNVGDRSLIDLLQEYEAVRTSNIHLFKYLSLEMLDFKGNVGDSQITPRAIAWFMVGHNIHHVNVVKELYTK